VNASQHENLFYRVLESNGVKPEKIMPLFKEYRRLIKVKEGYVYG